MKKKGPYGSLKNFTKGLIFIGIIACVAPFFLKGPDQRPLLRPDNLKLPDVKTPKISDVKIPGMKPDQQSEKIYKWKDNNGVWHFSDKKDPNLETEAILVTPSRSQKQTPSSLPTESETKNTGKENDSPSRTPFPMTISPSEVKKLKEDAEKIKVELEKRYEEMGKQIGNSTE